MPDLADTKPKSVEARERCLELGEKIGELRSIPADKRTDEQTTELRSTTTALLAANAEFDSVRSIEQYDTQAAAWQAAVKAADEKAKRDKRGDGPSAALIDLAPGARGMVRQLVDNDEYRAWAESGHGSAPGTPMPPIELRGSLSREVRTLLDSSQDGSLSDAGNLLPVLSPRAPEPRQLRMYIRDLVPSTPTTYAAVPYVRELTPATYETGATGIAEGAAKPEVTMKFEDDTAVVKKIAAWVPATMEILADAPLLLGYVYQRLSYMLALREQAQILNGAGSGAQLKGILQFSGVQTQGATNGDPFVDFAQAIGKVENVDGEANGIVMNPTDYWTTISLRRSTWFDGNVSNVGGAPFSAPDSTVWGLPVVRTRALTTLSAVVADWRGAMIFDRMQTTIRQSDSHDTFFIYNKVAILAEERLALACFRPDYFVNVTIDITP